MNYGDLCIKVGVVLWWIVIHYNTPPLKKVYTIMFKSQVNTSKAA